MNKRIDVRRPSGAGRIAFVSGLLIAAPLCTQAAPPHLVLADTATQPATDSVTRSGQLPARVPRPGAARRPTGAVAGVLFHEDFTPPPVGGIDPASPCNALGYVAGSYPFPTDWLLRNVDNRTPAAQVSYVNDAWEVREDFGADVSNCVAFSTSYYSPPGTAEDWMWTPQITLPAGADILLSWRASAYDPAFADGYEVRVMIAPSVPTGGPGDIGNQITDSTVLFSIAAEATSWTTREVDLGAYAGQGVRIGFRNRSNDKFLLVVDDILVQEVIDFDPALDALGDTSPGAGYPFIPVWFGWGADLAAEVRNNGSQALSDVVVDVDILRDGDFVTTISSPPVNLAPGAPQGVAVGAVAYDQIGTWRAEALVGAAEGDQAPDNSAQALALATVTGNELGRAEGATLGTVGIGAGNGGEIGYDFTLPVASVLESLSFAVNNDGALAGVEMQANLRAWDEIAGTPGAVLHTSIFIVPSEAPVGELSLEFPFDTVLPASRYVMTLNEPTLPTPQTLALQLAAERFTPGSVWINWPTSPFGGWANVEEFNVPAFNHSPRASAILRLAVFAPLTQDDAFALDEDTALNGGSVAGNDTLSDDGGNVFSLTADVEHGALAFNPDGSFDYTPAADYNGPDGFAYRLCDADDDCADSSVEIAVNATDDPPVAVNDSFEVALGDALQGDVSINDTASPDGENIWSVVAQPASGELTLQPDGSFTFIPASPGNVSFQYALCQAGNCAQATAAILVTGEQPPDEIFVDGFESP